jgi:adenine phosphoribosyltransferase
MTTRPLAVEPYLPLIRNVPDFPKPGILFKDITPLLQNGPALRAVIDDLADAVAHLDFDVVVGIESRGFLFAAPLAYKLGKGLALVRKPGKLPAQKMRQEYALEYGTDAIEMHVDALQPGQRALLLDDVLATGGTAAAAIALIERVGGTLAGTAFLVELGFLNGRDKLGSAPVVSLLQW